MGVPGLAEAPRFRGQADRLAHVEALEDIVRGWTRQDPTTGEDNAAVYGRLLGFDEERLRALADTGAV